MAFLRYADARLVHPRVTKTEWANIRIAGKGAQPRAEGKLEGDLIERASSFFNKPFDPNKYLLTHCFPPGHMVLMGDGTERPIEGVKIGDLVVTHKGNVRAVTRVLVREVSENLTVIRAASTPETLCTGEHPFYVLQREDVWCKVYPSYQGTIKCTFGNKALCAKHGCASNGVVPGWVAARDIRPGDRVYTPTLHETGLAPNLNPNRLRLLGYYAAEGRVDKDAKGRPHSIRFSLHDDENVTLAEEIRYLMRIEFGIATSSIIKDHKRATKGFTLAFHSFEHAPWFLRHVGNGSHAKRLSPEVMRAPISWQRRLVGAWINGDGCHDGERALREGWHGGGGGIRTITVSDDLASQARVLLDRMGVHCSLTRVSAGSHQYDGRWISGGPSWCIDIPCSYAHLLADSVKWTKFPQRLKVCDTKQRYRYAASTIAQVLSVGQRHYTGKVYNLSVDADESYVVNRQAVHNCTIVASVDVYAPPGVKTGSVLEDGFRVNRKFADFRIKPDTDRYINNNCDSWSRPVILASYPTFIGGQNFIEHVQIENQSKGRIIDAVARDIGDSVYVDILIATDRKHRDLIRAIEAGKMGTLSMGCSVDGTICTKCGHWAADETEMCQHIKYAKGNTFYDDQGRKHRVAELCGHKSIGPTGGVTFIEASWVGIPAFTGAVMRNIIEPTEEVARKARHILATPPPQWTAETALRTASGAVEVARIVPPARQSMLLRHDPDTGGISLTATRTFLSGWLEDSGSEEGAGDAAPAEGAAPTADKPKTGPLDELEEAVTQHVIDRVKKRLQKDMTGPEPMPGESSSTNETLNKLAAIPMYRRRLGQAIRLATNKADLMNRVASVDKQYGVAIPVGLYRAALKLADHDLDKFCRVALGRDPITAEAKTLVRLAKLLSRWKAGH